MILIEQAGRERFRSYFCVIFGVKRKTEPLIIAGFFVSYFVSYTTVK